MFTITRDGVPVETTTTENGAYKRLQQLQSQSAEWAMTHEGWGIAPADTVGIAPRETDHQIGRTPDGLRLVVSIRLELATTTGDTVDHQPVQAPAYRVAITGGVVDRAGRDYESAGQILEELDTVDRLTPGWSPADVESLRTIWQRWHLNDMRAACEHMPPAGELITEPDGFGGRRVSTTDNVCPVTGYKYGHAWLLEYVPTDVLAELVRLQSLPVGSLPAWARS